MLNYASTDSIRDQQWIADAIGCTCTMGGILVSQLPLIWFQEVPYMLSSNRFRVKALCLTCRHQGTFSVAESWLPDVDGDDSGKLMEVVSDFMRFEKRCDHRDYWCLSHSVVNDDPRFYRSPTANPRVHIACCLKCRRRGMFQLPIGLSNIANERVAP